MPNKQSLEDQGFVKPERRLVKIESQYVDNSIFNETLSKVIEALQYRQEFLQKKYPDAQLKLHCDYEDGSFEINVLQLESAFAYEQYVNEAAQSFIKERDRELATLKRLQAKYPNACIL